MQNAATTDKSNFFIHFQFNGFKTFRKIEKIPPPIIFGKKIYIYNPQIQMFDGF